MLLHSLRQIRSYLARVTLQLRSLLLPVVLNFFSLVYHPRHLSFLFCVSQEVPTHRRLNSSMASPCSVVPIYLENRGSTFSKVLRTFCLFIFYPYVYY